MFGVKMIRSGYMAKSPRMALTTFLKLVMLPTNDKFQQLSKYETPGGYDFYWSMKKAVSGIIEGKIDIEKAKETLDKLTNATERSHNLSGLKSAVKWLDKNPGTYFKPPSFDMKSPAGRFTIRLEPEIGHETPSGRKVIALWNTKVPELRKNTAGVGVALLTRELATGKFADCSFYILNLRTKKLWGPECIPNNAPHILGADIATIDALLKEILGP
jgi:hypothetical protein